MTQDTQAGAGAQPAPAQQSEALSLAQALDDNADLDAALGGNPKVCQLERDAAAELRRLQVRTIALESPAAAKCQHQGAAPAPVTFMAEDNACKWAWDQVREDVGTEGWTAGDSCTFHGFFLWGWNYRGQYETQRPAAPPAPAAVAVPESREAEIRDVCNLIGHFGLLIQQGEASGALEQLDLIKTRLRAALAAAPAQAVAVPVAPAPETVAWINKPILVQDGEKVDDLPPTVDFERHAAAHEWEQAEPLVRLSDALAYAQSIAAPAQEHATQGGSHGSA